MTATPSFRYMSVLGLALLAAMLTGCAIDQTREIEMGQEVAPQFEAEFGGLYPDERVQRYFSAIGQIGRAHV